MADAPALRRGLLRSLLLRHLVDVGVLATGGLGLLDGLVEGGHEIEDVARLLGLRGFEEGLVFPFHLHDLRHGVGVGVGELGALKVVPGHAVDEGERTLHLLLRHLRAGRVDGGRITGLVRPTLL
ncbi:hypothetical protein QQM39_45475 [Streptomyces sp. DT2A-34]|uniref:hypothetical protein n=1 Tax=Streptomyces sp. DT2A-34 TaxID=3051182 RepID=UPI00265C03C1|nr:hypothetical protein [Streptomyces sp. DT2A-34]MDO0917780.1 hypothetical protein [Streptomyces sp. DT2A-34]